MGELRPRLHPRWPQGQDPRAGSATHRGPSAVFLEIRQQSCTIKFTFLYFLDNRCCFWLNRILSILVPLFSYNAKGVREAQLRRDWQACLPSQWSWSGCEQVFPQGRCPAPRQHSLVRVRSVALIKQSYPFWGDNFCLYSFCGSAKIALSYSLALSYL